MDDMERAARAAHEVNRVYSLNVLDDASHLLWKDVPEEMRESVRDGVRAIADDPEISPQELHERWVAQKRERGWIYGSSKDVSSRHHPCLVPFGELPLPQRVKDVLFGATVRAVLGIEHRAVFTDVPGCDVKTDPGRGQVGQ